MPKLPHRLELRIAVIAALVLFMAQLGGLAHAYSHHPSAAPLSSHVLCDDCLNFAPLLAPAGTSGMPAPVLPLAVDDAQAATVAAFVQYKTLLAFRSRAPPAAR